MNISEDELRRIIKEVSERAAQDTVTKTLTSLGVDHENPLETQKDFAHVRDWRMAVERIHSKGTLVVMGSLIAGAMAALWIGFKEMVKGGGG